MYSVQTVRRLNEGQKKERKTDDELLLRKLPRASVLCCITWPAIRLRSLRLVRGIPSSKLDHVTACGRM